MASRFAFSTATIGSTSITNDEFVYGAGVLDESGWDVINTTADATNHRDRITKYGRGQMVLYGNRVSLAHPTSLPSLSFVIDLASANGATKNRKGVIRRALYSDAKQNTTIDFITDPVPPTTEPST